jgi:hypothetical protein
LPRLDERPILMPSPALDPLVLAVLDRFPGARIVGVQFPLGTEEPASMADAILLNAYPDALVKLACDRCGRAGQYRKGNLIVKYGAAMPLPDLLREIAKCPRAGQYANGCGVRYANLAAAE